MNQIVRQVLLLVALGCSGMDAAWAQTVADPSNVKARDVVLKPLSDFNVDKDPVPQLLQDAIRKPYDQTGLARCPAIEQAVRDLDTILGNDIDVAEDKTRGEKRGNVAGNVGKAIMGSLIPFGGVIREISGASANQRHWQMALYAGSARRSFLKGVGLQHGCRYPAIPAEFANIDQIEAERARIEAARKHKR